MGERDHRRGDGVYLELRGLHSPDVEDLTNPGFEDPEDFCILVRAFVGTKGEPGEDSFDFEVCTPRWLARHVRRNKPLFGRHYLFIDRWDHDAVRGRLQELCNTTSGRDYAEAAGKLARYGRWEFEDHRAHNE